MWLAFACLSTSIGVDSETSEVQIVFHQKMSLKRQFSPPPSHVARGAYDRILADSSYGEKFLSSTNQRPLSPMHVYTHLRTHTRSQETSAQTRSEFFFLFRDYGYAFSWLCSR